jgi:ubiquinol-cytochrome c reductase cytochrome c1 subunit
MTLSIRKTPSIRRVLAVAAAVLGLTAAAAPALAAGEALHPRKGGFSFEGPFGTFDQGQLQRGYKVYREVCAACHSMDLLFFRTLGEKNGPFYDPHAENPAANRFVRVLAAEATINDIDSETGENITRPGVPADRFPNPYPNKTAAAAGNGGAAPPDLSVMAKARHDGPNYIYSILTGYRTPPAGMRIGPGQHYNAYMAGDMTPFMPEGAEVPPGGFIAMAAPLSAGQVTFDDGTEATVDQMAKDVAAFISWASDPRQTERKQTGMGVLAFLAVFAGLTYASYRRIWKGIAH